MAIFERETVSSDNDDVFHIKSTFDRNYVRYPIIRKIPYVQSK